MRKLESQEKEIIQKQIDRINLFWAQVLETNSSAYTYDFKMVNESLQDAVSKFEKVLQAEEIYDRYLKSLNNRR